MGWLAACLRVGGGLTLIVWADPCRVIKCLEQLVPEVFLLIVPTWKFCFYALFSSVNEEPRLILWDKVLPYT